MRRNFNWYKESPVIHPILGELEKTDYHNFSGWNVKCPACGESKHARYMVSHISQQARKGDKTHKKFMTKNTKPKEVRVWK